MINIKLKTQFKLLIIFILFVLLVVGIIVAYAFIPAFNANGLASLPQIHEEINTYSALCITGYYDNIKADAKNIKTTQIILFDQSNYIIEILVKEEGYTLDTLRKELDRLKSYENQLYFGIKSFNNSGISYTSVLYTLQRKEEFLKYVHGLRDYTITELP